MKLIILPIVISGLCACTSTAIPLPPPAHQQQAFATASPRLNTVNIIDDALQQTHLKRDGSTHIDTKLAVEGAGQAVLETGAREVWVTLRNLTDYPQNVETRVTWYDAAEKPVDGPTAWDRLMIPANGAETYTNPSVHPAAQAFYVEVRELR